MIKYQDSIASTVDGTPLIGAQISVVAANGSQVPIFGDAGGTTQLTQPILSNQQGYFSFYIADGRYTIIVVAGGVTLSRTDVEIVDALALKGRALLAPENDSGSIIPPVIARAGKLLAFLPDGTATAAIPNSFSGPPGGNGNLVGLLTAAPNLTIPTGTDVVSVSGFVTVGDSGAGRQFVYDATVNAAYVTANPQGSFVDKAGRGFRLVAALDPKSSMIGQGRAFNRNAVLCAVGDSITDPLGQWPNILPNFTGEGGPFEGWTIYDMAANGQTARAWAGSVANGNQAAPPQNVGEQDTNLWRVVNGDPDEILVNLGTNDIRMLGAGKLYADLPSAVTGLTADLTAILNFLLARTSARILLECRAPFVYIAGSTSGLTDFTGADDAAARGAAIRAIYRSFRNMSSRVTVIDTQRHMFPSGTAAGAYRWDTLAAAVDPEGTGIAMMLDELHFSQVGQVRRGEIIARVIDPSTPHSPIVTPAPAITHQGSLRSTRAFVKGVGAGYIDFYSDSVRNLLGSLTEGYPRASLKNIPRYKDLLVAGADSYLGDMLRASRLGLVDSAGTPLTFSPQSVVHNQYDGSVGDYFRVTIGGGVPAIVAGPCDLYINDAGSLPPMPAAQLATSIRITGAANKGAALLPLASVSPTLNSAGINAVRQASAGACVIGLYVANQADGSYAGSVTAAAPGYRLGAVNIGAGGLIGPGFVFDATHYPGGYGSLPDPVNYQTCLVASVESGAVGDWAEIVVRPR